MCCRAKRHLGIPLSTTKQHNDDIRSVKLHTASIVALWTTKWECLAEADWNIVTERCFART